MKIKIAFTRYECDRCNTKHDDLPKDHFEDVSDPAEEWGRIWKNIDGPLDLCPGCKQSFIEWLNAPNDWIKTPKEG